MSGAAGRARGPALLAPPPLLFLGAFGAGLLLDRAAPPPALPLRVRRAGPTLIAAGVALGAWFIATMRRAGTPIDPTEAPTVLVTGGPFRFTRNPGYAGLTLTYAGVALTAGARWPLMLLPAALATLDRGVVRREERYLTSRFGSSYEEYRGRVRRWL